MHLVKNIRYTSCFQLHYIHKTAKQEKECLARVQLQLKTGIIKSFAVLGGSTVPLLEPELPTHQHKTHTHTSGPLNSDRNRTRVVCTHHKPPGLHDLQ